MTALLALAFGAGLLAPVNPCGFAVLPAFLAYTVGTGDRPVDLGRGGVLGRLVGGLRAGGGLTAGFAGTFIAVGLLLAFGVRALIGMVPWLAVVLGVVLTLAGLVMLAGRHLPLRLPGRRASTPGTKPKGMVAFGAGYALASASCTLPLLLAVVTQALASTNAAGVAATFGAYATGAATLLMTLALFAAFASGLISRYLKRLLPYMSRIAGAVLALSGGYLILYWLPELIGAGRPGGTGALTNVVGHLSTWITEHQVQITATALVLILASAVIAIAMHRHPSTPASAEHCCLPATDDCGTPPRRDASGRNEATAHHKS